MVQGQCQMLRGILCGGSPRGGLCPGHQLAAAAAQDGWLWRSVKLHEGKRCSRGPSFLGRVRHKGEDSFSLLPTVGCPPPPGVPGPPSPFLPEHLAASQGSASASLLCPANRDGSADRLPATAEINPRNMARGPSISKGNLDRCPISSGFCCILCLPRCRLGGPCGALCPSAPAHCQARLALRGTSCAFPILKSSSLDKYPGGSHACNGASFLLNQGIGKKEPWLFLVPANAAESADIAVPYHGTAILHIPDPRFGGLQAPE